MVSFVSNGDLVVQQKNCEACQYLEFFCDIYYSVLQGN